MKFLNHLTFGQYVPADSPVHRLDPRCKILAVLVILTGVFMARHAVVFAVWGVLLLLLARCSRLPARLVLNSAKPVLILVVFTALIHIFFTDGKPLLKLWIITITQEGVAAAVQMGLRLLLLVLFASFLTLTTKPMELADGLERLFSPFARFGFPAHELAMMMTIALRFIPTLLEETDKIMKAQMARGADFESGNLIQRAKSLIPLLVPLFISAFRIAQDLAMAMEARCYRGGDERTRMNAMVLSKIDAAASLFMLLFISVVIVQAYVI